MYFNVANTQGLNSSDQLRGKVFPAPSVSPQKACASDGAAERLLSAAEEIRLITRLHGILPPPHYVFLHSGMTEGCLEISHSLNIGLT